MIDVKAEQTINERAVLVGLITPSQDEERANEYLDELAFLAETAGAETVGRFLQRVDYPNPRTFVGKGKLDEIRIFIEENDVAMAIFDDDLTSKQVLNIERELKVKILDRTSLILDIFAKRAQTANAKTQVELAQYQYLLPRLTRMWTHLERQRGGIGMRGPGETQIETDRRIILDKIARLKEELRAIDGSDVTATIDITAGTYTDGISSTSAATGKATVRPGYREVTVDPNGTTADITIYSIGGGIVHRSVARSAVSIALYPGFYIVKAGTTVQKIGIK